MQQIIAKTLTLFCLLFLSTYGKAQKFEWVNFFQGQSDQRPISMSVDQNGNQYATFNFYNEIKIDTLTVKTSYSNQKGFIIKQNTNGKILWNKTIDAVGYGTQTVYTIGSMFNSKGNLIVFSACNVNLKIGKDTVKRIGSAGTALYLIEFDDTGKIINSLHLLEGSILSLGTISNRIACDKNDNIYLGLEYAKEVKVHDSTGITSIGSASTPSRHLIIKFSNSGRNYKWSNSLYSSIQINSLKVDIDGNVYVATMWNSAATFSFKGKTIKNPQSTTGTVFIWDKNGKDKNWFYIESSGQKGSIYDIAVHDSNSVFISGIFVGDSARFDTIWKKNKYGTYMFFARYNANGKLKWVKVEDTTYSVTFNGYNYYSSMTNYRDIYIYLSEYRPNNYSKPVIYDGQKYMPNPNGYGLNMKIDERGNILWGFRSYMPFASMGTGNDDDFYFQGTWSADTIKFGSFKAYPNGNDAFIGKTFDYAIFRGNIYSGPYCAGDSLFVPYTIKGTFANSNTFFAEISDEFGNFIGQEREIGRLKSKDSGTIRGVLPMFKVASSGRYRIRIRSTSPQAQSFYKEDSLRLLIYSRDKADPGPPETICYGDSIQISTYGGTKWTWSPKYNMTDSTKRQPFVWPIKNTTYKIIIDDSSGCGAPDTAYKKILLRKPLKLTIAFKDTVVCDTSVLKLPMSFEGGDSANYYWQSYSVLSSKVWQKLESGKLKLKDTLTFKPKVTVSLSQKVAIVLDDKCTNKKDTAYLNISLLKPCIIISKFRDTLLCVGNKILFKATTLYPSNNYTWQWKDVTKNKVLSINDSLNLTADTTKKIKLVLSNGCTTDSTIFTINVNPPLEANIFSGKKLLNDTTLCYRQALKLFSKGTGGTGSGYNFEWYFDGFLLSRSDSLMLQSPSYYPDSGGFEKVMLIVKDNCTTKPGSYVKTVTVVPTPNANFSFGTSCDLSNTNFTFTGTKPQLPLITSFNWDFGGSLSSSNENPQVLLSSIGSRKITLTVNCNNGCKDEISKTVNVRSQAKADFNANNVCEWDSAYFINKSIISKGNLNFIWTFGDGNNSNIQSPKYLYQKGVNPKTYRVQLLAVVKDGCSDSIIKTISVFESPKADFSYGIVCSRTSTDFNFKGAIPKTPITTTFLWNFNNESNSSIENPSKIFSNPGTKTINLTLTSSNGCIDSLKRTITIMPQSKADFTTSDVCETDSVVFKNLSQDATSYNWKFGDGKNSTHENPKHKYSITTSTTFNVSLVAAVSGGCSDSVVNSVTINENPKSDFTYTQAANGKVDFKANQSIATNYRWLFGNGDSVKVTNPNYSYTYKKSSNYNVCLKVINTAGCQSETCKQLAITGGVSSLAKPSGFKIYPNPNTGNFTIEIENPGKDVSIEVYNLVGELVKRVERVGKVNSIEMPMANGIYLVRVKDGVEVWNQKVSVCGDVHR